MKTLLLRIFCLLAVSILLLSACSPKLEAASVETPSEDEVGTIPPGEEPAAEHAGSGFTVSDALGREVIFEKPPQRFVLTGKAWFMLADAIYLFPEARELLVGIGKTTLQGVMGFFSVVDPGLSERTLLERDATVDDILSLRPDVVLMKSYLRESQGMPLEELGIPVVYLDFETPDQYQRDLQTLGELFQNEARADSLKAFFRDQVELVSKKTASLADENKPQVLLVYYDDSAGSAAVKVPPLSWIQVIMIEMAGGIPVWKEIELGGGWTEVNFEQIAAWNPEKIFVVSYDRDVEDVVDLLEADLNWQALDAMRNGELYAFPMDYINWDQADTRWILGFSWLATRIQPELFADLDLSLLTQEFFTELYGLDTAVFETEILPLIEGDYP
ncbi:MAG: ABC transporter substrate-binding protein [Anaerolineaceae bacterium]|nr:ABC transporter substrate-binding protein [Anaerolineaceae bacterium]